MEEHNSEILDSQRPFKLEICAADIQSISAAREGGADRIELCQGLECGGLTPSHGMLQTALKIADKKMDVNVLIRPRSGDFLYSKEEKNAMYLDALQCYVHGAKGIVIGALCADGEIDLEYIENLRMMLGDELEITFHRAIDLCRDIDRAVEQLISVGVNRILTSGGAQTAMEGIDTLQRLNEKYGNDIIIMPGAGVTIDNIHTLLSQTGVREIHASAKEAIGSLMQYRKPGVNMGLPGTDEFRRFTTSTTLVKELTSFFTLS